jgi:hypothetical protein
VSNLTRSLRPGHVYIWARRGRPGTNWDWDNYLLAYSQHVPSFALFAWIFTFKFIRRPLPSILSPSSRTFAELNLVTPKTRGSLTPLFYIWDSTRIYNSGRISGATDKGIDTKAHYLSTPGARLGNSPMVIRPMHSYSQNMRSYCKQHFNLYRTRPDPWDLATYI